VYALYKNNTGNYNTAAGYAALYDNTKGSSNIAEGYKAGFNLTTGSNNIDIGNQGVAGDGAMADSGVIRIGTQTPTALQINTYIAGIYTNTTVSGLYVVIDSNGQLGVSSVTPAGVVKAAYTPKLLKEMQRQAAEIRDLKQQMAEMKILNQAMQAALQKLQVKDQLVAQR
jgi:hypothetical protein